MPIPFQTMIDKFLFCTFELPKNPVQIWLRLWEYCYTEYLRSNIQVTTWNTWQRHCRQYVNSLRKNYPELCFITLTCVLCCNWDVFLVTLSLSLLAFEHCQQTIALMQAIYRSNCDVSHKTNCCQPVFQLKRFLSRCHIDEDTNSKYRSNWSSSLSKFLKGFSFGYFSHATKLTTTFTNSKYPSNWSSGLSQKRQRGVG